MDKRNLLLATLLIAVFATGVIAGEVLREYLIPTIGTVTKAKLSVTWLNGTEVTKINWGIVPNATETALDPINITNMGNIPVTLTLNATDSVNITSLSLTWNYTGALAPNEWQVVVIKQNVTASADTFSYFTKISVVG